MTRKTESMIDDAARWLASDNLGCSKIMKENLNELYIAYIHAKAESVKLTSVLIEAAALGMKMATLPPDPNAGNDRDST